MADSRSERLDKLIEYHSLLKQLLSVADKSVIEEAARVLGAHVGYYERRFGKVPMEETLASLHAEYPTDEQIAELAQGLETLIAILMLATGVADDAAGSA